MTKPEAISSARLKDLSIKLQDLSREPGQDFWKALIKTVRNYIPYDCCTLTGMEGLEHSDFVVLSQWGERAVEFLDSNDTFSSDKGIAYALRCGNPIVINSEAVGAGQFCSTLFLPLLFAKMPLGILKFGSYFPGTYSMALRENYLQTATGIASASYCYYLHQQLSARDKQVDSLLLRINNSQPEPASLTPSSQFLAVQKLTALLPHIIESRNQKKLRQVAQLLAKSVDKIMLEAATE